MPNPCPRPAPRLLRWGQLCQKEGLGRRAGGGRGEEESRDPRGLTRGLHVVLLNVGHVRVQRAVQVGEDHLPAVVIAQAQQPCWYQARQRQRAGQGKAERCGRGGAR